MLQSLINIKLIALAAALGLNTEDWIKPSTAMVEQVTSLESAMKLIEEGKSDQVGTKTQEAVTKIKELADKGDKDAQFAIALLAQNQQGGAAVAMEYYKKAADQGQLQATNNLGFLTMAQAKGMPEAEAKVKVAEGVAMIEKASKAGNNPARRNMAQLYLSGQAGVKQDVVQAKALLEVAAGEGDGQAMYELSQYYSGGAGKENQNDLEAKKWLEKSATGKNASPNGLDTLGSLLLQGGKIGSIEIKKDEKAAVAQFRALADLKNPIGLRKMGGVCETGLADEPKDYKKAVAYYQAAARGNDALAQFRLASMLDQGWAPDAKQGDKPEDIQKAVIVGRDDSGALNLYKLAAQNNLAIALYNVGVFYEQGRAVDKDVTKAFAAFLQAAQSGVALGMQKAGIYYANGAGTLKDPIAAAGWFQRAASSGLAEASLAYGQIIEAGAGPVGNLGENPYISAGQAYDAAANNPNANDAVVAEALLRLGSLYFRGAMGLSKENPTPKGDFGKAYVYFKQAADLVPDAPLPKQLIDAAKKELDTAKIANGDDLAAKAKKSREENKKKAQNPAPAAAAAETPAAAPVAAPAAAPAADPVAPKATKTGTKK